MDSGFRSQIPVSEFTLHFKSRVLDPATVARLQIREISLESAPLSPAQIEPQEHLGPVLRFGAARARMNRDDRAQPMVFAAKHQLEHMTPEFRPRRL